MTFARVCTLVALGAVAQVARAELPVSGAALGQLEAVLEHCGRASPATAEQYRELARGLTGSATDKEVVEARKSAEYRDAHDAASAQLDTLSKEESHKACAEGLQPAAN
jgi:hypothetical protein